MFNFLPFHDSCNNTKESQDLDDFVNHVIADTSLTYVDRMVKVCELVFDYGHFINIFFFAFSFSLLSVFDLQLLGYVICCVKCHLSFLTSSID